MSRALIVGGAGFVGAYLAQALLARGDTVCITKLPTEVCSLPGAEVRDLDILDREAVLSLLREQESEHIYHLAAQSSVALSWQRPALTIDVNIKGSCTLLEALASLKSTARVLMLGSGEEYGYVRPEECPVKEDNPLRPGNVYAATKAAQNMLAGVYARAYGLNVLCTRAFNHIGPAQREGFVVADLCKQVARIEAGRDDRLLVGNLEARRDFTDVRDVVRAYALLMDKGVPGETYNIGCGAAISIRELLERILNMAKCPIRVEQDPARLRPSDVPCIEADISKLRAATGWEPLIPLEETLAQCLDYWRARQE